MTQPAPTLKQELQIILDEDQLTNCMRCGFCLPACPTYRNTGHEAASPRGRIALMKAVYDGLMEPDAKFAAQMNLCLGCRACEPACPSDVKYGHLLEQARHAIEKHEEHRLWVKAIRKFVFYYLFPYQRRMQFLGGLLRFYQKSGIQWLFRKLRILHLLPLEMRQMEKILPLASRKGVVEELGTFVQAIGEKKGAVGMFRGCLMDVLFTETNRNTIKLLTLAGYDVYIPPTQNCCGALHAHSGEVEKARQLAQNNIKAFQGMGVDYIISNAGGCGALLVEYDHLLKDEEDRTIREGAKWFAERVRDISDILSDPVSTPLPLNEFTGRITYQDSCHLRNVMKGGAAPRKLLQSIPAATYIELTEAERCCGSAGIYNLVQPEMSMNLLDEKMEFVEQTEAHLLVTANPGCLLQMKLGLKRAGLEEQIHTLHIVDLLAENLRQQTEH